MQKFDPYINIDPGTLNPYEHGECYYEPTAGTADTVVVVLQSCVVVAFVVHIHGMELNDVGWTGHNTQITTFTALCVYDDCSSCFSHRSNVL